MNVHAKPAAQAAPATRAVRAAIESDASFGAVVPPIVLSSNFSFAGLGGKRAYDYSRSGNPTRDQLGAALADLEGGAGATVTASGMAAVALIAQALLKPGDRVLAPHDCYGGSWRLFKAFAAKGLFDLETCDFTNPEIFAEALSRRPTLVWIETPSNPLLRITDLEQVVGAARLAGALTVADNTFLSPLLQRPIDFGVDAVVHSTTKYINGHSDVVGGAVIARNPALHDELAWWANCLGVTGAPFDSFLTLRGLRTLKARLDIHQRNACQLAELLKGHSAVERVYYPGLESHPGHAIAARQQNGFGAILSFELKGEQAVRVFLDGLRHITLAESLGSVESLIAHPATMTHAAMTEDARAEAGIGPGLLRLSVGIEDADDLAGDLGDALVRVEAAQC